MDWYNKEGKGRMKCLWCGQVEDSEEGGAFSFEV
jgi:hypothetical protein